MWLVVAGLWPAPEPLAVVLGRFDARAPSVPAAAGDLTWDGPAGAVALAPRRRRWPDWSERARADLRVLGRRPEGFAGETIVYGLFGFMLGPWLGLGDVAGRRPVPGRHRRQASR